MMNGFKSGNRLIPRGTLDFVVSGLDLDKAPSSVSVSVRQPSAEADIITAYVVGTPTADGFSVTLSSPAERDDYTLDFTAFISSEYTPVSDDSLAVGYEDLEKEVARFLGYDPQHLNERESAEVDSYIQSGVRNFYYPPKTIEAVDDNFEWSFIRQSGSVQTSADIDNYFMPNGFNRIAGQINVAMDEGPSIPIISYGDIVRMQTRPLRGRPRFAAITSAKIFGSRGQKRILHLYPTPDKEYQLNFVCDADTGKLNREDNPFPLGGAMFSELVTESCLAVAEQRGNDEEGLHTKKFAELLVAMISRDRKSSAQVFGDIGDPEQRMLSNFFPLRTRGCLY